MKGLPTLIKAILPSLIVFLLGLIIKRFTDMDIFSVTELAGFCVVLTLILYLFIGWEKRSEQRGNGDKSRFFPRLSIPVLEKCAARWAKIYAPMGLKKITLYEAPIGFPFISVRYILVFEFRKTDLEWGGKKLLEKSAISPETLIDDSFYEVYQRTDDLPKHHEDLWFFQCDIPEGADKRYAIVIYDK